VLDVLTWHVHGSYLQALARVPVRWILPVGRDDPGYGGRSAGFEWPDNVVEVEAAALADCAFDAVVYQHLDHYTRDRMALLTPSQRDRPAIYVEHDPPRRSPTDTVHPVDDGRTVVVHVTHYNQLMWDNGGAPTVVIEHGISPAVRAGSLTLDRGIVVVNHLARRGRRLGADIFLTAAEQLPLDLIGMGAEELGGLGEVAPGDVVPTVSRYRFTFSPIRHTSLGLGILEAMGAGLPVVGLATSELATVVANGVHGFVHTDLAAVIAGGRALVGDRSLALELGANARRLVAERFAIDRFVADWSALLERTAGG
jgi:glycosyltransferase involved in cell wall biosynthesis